MVRTIIYPEAEDLIQRKKALKNAPPEEAHPAVGEPDSSDDDDGPLDYEEESEEENVIYEASTSGSTIRAKKKRRDTPEERAAKKRARTSSTSKVVRTDTAPGGCNYCGGEDHKTRKSRRCPGHVLDINETIFQTLGPNEHFTVSLPLRSFIHEQLREQVTRRIIRHCQYQREWLFKTMLFMNYFIINLGGNILPREFFTQNFIYRMALLVRGSSTAEAEQITWPKVPNLVATFNAFLTAHPTITIFQGNSPSPYSNSLSSACVTLGTVYNNFYVETCDMRMEKFLFHLVKRQFPEFSKAIINIIVQNYLRPLFIDGVVPENFDLVPNYSLNQFVNYFNGELVLLRRTFPAVPLPFNKVTFAANPGQLLPIFRFIAETFERYHRDHQNDDPQPPLPTRFSLHPNPSYRWKFMAMDASVASSFSSIRFPRNRETADNSYLHNLTIFSTVFDFTRLRIDGLDGLIALPVAKQQMFRNSISTDGYTCVVHFSRARRPADVNLELQDFNAEEVNLHFRPCAIDPGRTDAFTAEYPDGQSRSLGTHEYYNMTGSIARSRQLNIRKREHNIQEIETNIPSPKVTTINQFNVHVTYVLRHLRTLFDFYGPNSAVTHWKAYCGKQKAIEEAVNILINGGKKYNAGRRDKHKTHNNKQWRRRTRDNRRVLKERRRQATEDRRNRRIATRQRYRAAAAAAGRRPGPERPHPPQVPGFPVVGDTRPDVPAGDNNRATDAPHVEPAAPPTLEGNNTTVPGAGRRIRRGRQIGPELRRLVTATNVRSERLTSGGTISERFQADILNSGPLRAIAFQSDGLNTTGRITAAAIRSRRITANDVLASNVRANRVNTGDIEAENVSANRITAGNLTATDFQADNFVGTDVLTEMFESLELAVEDYPMEEAQDLQQEHPPQQVPPQHVPPQHVPPQQGPSQQNPTQQQAPQHNNRRNTNFGEGNRALMPLIVFGTGMMGADNVPFAGHMTGITGTILNQLHTREGRGECYVLLIDEFRTSRVCRLCFHDQLIHPRDPDNFPIHAVLFCPNCRTVWNRDRMASGNMSYISQEIWAGRGRPVVFQRQRQQ